MTQQTTERAWQSYARRLPTNTKHCTEAREDLCAFVGVQQHTVRRWITANSVRSLGGLTIIKLRCFLESEGFEITELRHLNKTVRVLAEIVGYGIVPLSTACAEIEGENSERAVSRIYDLLQGRVSEPTEQRMASLEVFVAKHRDALDEKKSRLRSRTAVPNQETSGLKELEEVTVSQLKVSEDERTLTEELFVSWTPSFLKIAEVITSDDFSPEERRRIRERLGDRLFRLSTAMNRLSSETGRRQYDTQQTTRRKP